MDRRAQDPKDFAQGCAFSQAVVRGVKNGNASTPAPVSGIRHANSATHGEGELAPKIL